MYGIFAYIYHKNQPNVGKYTPKYTIHGRYMGGNQIGLYSLYAYMSIYSKQSRGNLSNFYLGTSIGLGTSFTYDKPQATSEQCPNEKKGRAL